MKKLNHYLNCSTVAKRATMLLAVTTVFVSLQGCRDEPITPFDRKDMPKHPPTEDGAAPRNIDGTAFATRIYKGVVDVILKTPVVRNL